MPAAARVGRLFVVERQLLTSLKVSNFDQTATKECMILHVRPPERLPPPPDTPAARLKEPKSKATCVRDPECVDCSGFFLSDHHHLSKSALGRRSASPVASPQ
jgi:hypothetical protein